jgi:hypothetical protein
MNRIRIFTNNPAVAGAYPDFTRWQDGDVSRVFTAVRDAVHKGARIVSHPLSGSVKPWQSPYKSVAVFDKTGALDFASLQMIEDAIAVLNRGRHYHRPFDESVAADFRIIDLDFINNAMEAHHGRQYRV